MKQRLIKDNVPDTFKGLLLKAADAAISVKFFVIILTTLLFYVDKLNQDGWITMILTITGMRLANELGAMYKDIRVGRKGNK